MFFESTVPKTAQKLQASLSTTGSTDTYTHVHVEDKMGRNGSKMGDSMGDSINALRRPAALSFDSSGTYTEAVDKRTTAGRGRGGTRGAGAPLRSLRRSSA